MVTASLYSVRLSEGFLGADAPAIVNDIARMVCIQATIQFMFAVCKPEHNVSLDEFASMLLFVVLGVAVYWLIFRKIVALE